MITTDIFSDFICRIKNANMIYSPVVESPANKVVKETARILKEEGFIVDFQINPDGNREKIRVLLKFTRDRVKGINNIERVSKSGRRVYSSCEKLPKVKRGIGISIVSTSHGLMTDKQARKSHLGGEIFCNVW